MSNEKTSHWLAYRRVWIVLVHLGLWAMAGAGAYLLRFEFRPTDEYVRLGLVTLPALLVFRLLAFWQQRLYHGLWRYTGSKDLISILIATTAATLFFALYCTLFGFRNVPRSIFVIEWLLATILVAGTRFAIRKIRELSLEVQADAQRRNVLIVGAGDAGEALLRDLTKTHAARYRAVGYVDDAVKLQGVEIHGVRVIGHLDDVPALCAAHQVDEIIIAIPTATGKEMRHIVECCKPSGLPLRTIPGINQLIDGHVQVSGLRDVAIEDLLGREPITLDTELIDAFIKNRVVVVSGAGGSIGSELCRQVSLVGCKTLVLVEKSENALFEIHR